MTQDLTAITTPFGLLDEQTQGALRSAGAAGAKIEYFGNLGWEVVQKPIWNDWYAYRVKLEPPKPREWWLTICDGYIHVHSAPIAARIYTDHNTRVETVHVREVL